MRIAPTTIARRPGPAIALLAAALSFTGAPVPAAAQQAEGEERADAPPPLASPEEVARLSAEHRLAAKDGDALALAAVLGKMAEFANPEFAEPALEGLRYRASRADVAAAREEAADLGLRDKREIEALVLEREVGVQAAAARVLAHHPGKKTENALLRTFRDKKTLSERPAVAAAVVESLGRLGVTKIERDVESELRRYRDGRVTRACVRYFGWIRTRRKAVVKLLCRELSAPEPGHVDSATNPPASYWEARWKAWNQYRRDVTWALQRITGQVFRPAEGDFPGDTRKALEWVDAHAKELGLR